MQPFKVTTRFTQPKKNKMKTIDIIGLIGFVLITILYFQLETEVQELKEHQTEIYTKAFLSGAEIGAYHANEPNLPTIIKEKLNKGLIFELPNIE